MTQEPRFFSEDVVIYDRTGNRKLTLRLPSGQHALANKVVEQILGTGTSKSSDSQSIEEKTEADLAEISA